MGPFLPSYEGFFTGNIYYKHCKFNLIFSDLVWLLKNPAKTKVFLSRKVKFCMVNLETHSFQTKKTQGDSTNRKKDITILLPLSFICADCTVNVKKVFTYSCEHDKF
jgi:hypothetical protein